MRSTRHRRGRFTLLAITAAATVAALHSTSARGIPSDAGAVEHALSRLTFGARPGDAERVRAMGLDRWIDLQLHPSRIDDDAIQRRLPAPLAAPADLTTQRAVQQFGRQSVQHLAATKIIRAVYSERQLEEVLVDFWFNHFNVFAGKGRTSQFLTDYERNAIRPHVLGRFRDLLGATATSPAMLFYLDNWLSADPAAAERAANAGRRQGQPAPAAGQGRRRGLNENYARELLELHTLGVDGGYTQQDIIEVARAFTGWSIARPRQQAAARGRRGAPQMASMDGGGEGQFRFMPALHDAGRKTVLGHTIDAGGGIEDGERVLDIVAAHPSTARHVATKLVRHFVSDDPPPALVERVAQRFRDTRGDLRDTVRAMITDDEFFAAGVRRSKVKTPLEFVVSAVRATGRELPDARPVLQALQQLGMAPYMCQPPTGYDDSADAWISAGALVSRMNIAQVLAGPDAAAIGGPAFQRQ